MKEEQRKAEIEAKIRSFESKQELEMAKMKLKLQEEKLQLKTDLEISDARSKVLEKYEQSGDELEDKISTHSKVFRSLKQATADNPGLNAEAKPFKPENVFTTKVFQPNTDITDNVQSVVNKCNIEHRPLPQAVNVVDSQSANELGISSVIKNLRKPVSDIKKFCGDPLEFRKFYRQFQTRIIVNAESEEEKLTYLEQFTTGEANKVVSGYGHLSGSQAFDSAMKTLEDRYGDQEVIANAFIKKALTWHTIQPGDAKALDEFSLFLIECKNAIESIDAVRILEYSENIKSLMKKLPLYFHDRWRNVVQGKRDKKETIKFEDFVNFVSRESRKLNDPVYGNTALATVNSKNAKFVKQVKDNRPKHTMSPRNSFATNLSNDHSKARDAMLCSFCGKNHSLEYCKEILTLGSRAV